MSTDTAQNNKRIAKNTAYLYIRMFLSMAVGIYTSRVILHVLGTDDYGVFGVVGSVVAMLGFLNASMSGATSRFLTFELGKGNIEKLKNTFSTALWIHIGISIIVLIFAETIGLWIINNKLDIPSNRVFAANIVYQCSILSAIISITQVPYNATIISHERMDVYAYTEIVNTFLKLGIVYLLHFSSADKLIQYAISLLIVTIIIALFYRLYAIRNFEESHFCKRLDKTIAKEIGSYTAFSLFSSFAWIGKRNVTIMLINVFFGVAVNAAAALATTVSGIIQGFTSNVITAIRPPLVTLYAQNKQQQFLSLLYKSILLMVFLMSICAIPLILEMDYILKLWLKEVPLWTSSFCKLSLLSTPLFMAETVINIANSANGNIRNQCIFSGTATLIQLPIVYIAFQVSDNPLCAEIVTIFFSIILFTGSSYCTKINIPYLNLSKIIIAGFKSYLLALLTGALVWYIQCRFQSSLSRLICTIILYEAITIPIGYFVLLDKDNRQYINLILKTHIKKLL